MFNPLEVSTDDINQLFDLSATDVLINDIPTKAIVTNINLMTSNEDRNLHTLSKVSMGDVVTYQDEYYLIITETITKRHSKYKTLMRHCNHSIEFQGEIIDRVEVGKDELGRPIYEDVYGDPVAVPLIISDEQSIRIADGAVRLGDDQIIIKVTDNEFNREKFEANERIELFGQEWSILSQNFTQKGLISVTCEQQ